MTDIARVVQVTNTHRHDQARTPIDVVALHWAGKAYAWQTERGRYAVGDEVPINPPATPAGNISPA